MRIFFITAVIISLFLIGCGLIQTAGDSTRLLFENHPLSGKIWDVNNQRFVDKEKLAEKLTSYEYLLLGETHDNPEHHKYQAWVIDKIRSTNRSSFAAFEMISQSQGKFLKSKNNISYGELLENLNQVKTNWKYDENYGAIFRSTLAAGYAIYPANLDRDTILGIARKGEENIPSHINAYLSRNRLTAEQKQALSDEIRRSHCGMENPHMTKAMMLTQRVKDAVMADSLLRKADVDSRVLIAGSGHVRNDRGVPMYLRRENPDATILAVAWLEVAEEHNDVGAYAEYWADGRLPFDYVWFTARRDRPDPCKEFERHMKKRNKTKI